MKSKSSILVGICAGFLVSCQAQGPQTRQTAFRTETVNAAGPAVQSYADVVSRVSPAVVTVPSARRSREPEAFPFSFGGDPRLRDFFEGFGAAPRRGPQGPPQAPGQGQGRLQRGLGSGVIIRSDGQCVTNHHVVDGAEEIKVELTDGRILDAKLIGSDPASDLALLKIEASGLPVLALGNSDAVRVGDVVLAVGNAENEADAMGARILYEAGYDPLEMARFFQKLEESGGSRAPEFLSSHPNPGSRVRHVSAEIRTFPAKPYQAGTGRFPQIQRVV